MDPTGYFADWIVWAIWAAIIAAEGVYLYNNWPFNKDFDPSTLQDTGERFWQPLPTPDLPTSFPSSLASPEVFHGLRQTATISAGARLGMGAAAAGELAVPGVGEVVGAAIVGILLYQGAAALRQAYEEWDRGFEIIGYHATTAANAQSIMNQGFRLSRSDLRGDNRFGPGYYLSDTPQHAAAEHLNKYGYQPEAILQVRARMTKNLIVGGPLAERPISRWIGVGGRAAGGSLTYGAFAPGAEEGINYVLFDPLHQVRSQERVR